MENLWLMFDDTLWIYTAIAGSLLGAAFLAWFRNTHMASWCMARIDRILDALVDRWGWSWLQDDPLAWRKRYPKITQKIDEMEAQIIQLEVRIKNLENGKKVKVIRQKEKN